MRILQFRVAPVLFALFLCAGEFKADPHLQGVPVDLTIALGGVVVTCVIWRMVRCPVVPRAIGWVLVLFACVTVAALWTTWTPYAVDKTLRFVTLTLLSALAPLFLIDDSATLNGFLGALAAIGILMSLDASAILASGGELARLTATGSNTIALGRAAGLAALVILSRVLDRRLRLLWGGPVVLALFVVLFASGSRGPLSFFVLAAISLAAYHSKEKRTIFLAALVVVGVFVAVSHALPHLPSRSVERITDFFLGGQDASAQERVRYAHVAWGYIKEHPVGNGMGGFALIYPHSDGMGVYPHNVLLEIAVESGWGSVLLFGSICIFSLWRSLSLARIWREYAVVFAIELYAFGNACVSGDFNDNRLLFAFIAISFVLPRVIYQTEGASHWTQVTDASSPIKGKNNHEEDCCSPYLCPSSVRRSHLS